ncbi:MAG: HD domain-containing protein [Oscillospiraceae bacterium]|jgi:HD superfamily phosphodiesterase|nr:HD domain-containing protein [Oscillospiraceae bacterium]
MSQRLEILRGYLDAQLNNIADAAERKHAFVHLYGVGRLSAFIAMRRGVDAELAMIAGLLHDIHTYTTGDGADHAHKGAALADVILTELGIVTEAEKETVCAAIYNHSDKDDVSAPFDEALKDADVLQHCLYNADIQLPQDHPEAPRCARLKDEFGLR